MNSTEALLWYQLGFDVVCGVIGGPFLVVYCVRLARSFLSA